MRKMLDRLALFFRENWRQMLVIAIAVALPSSLALSGSDRKYGYLITDTIFVMGAFFFLASQIGKWGKILMHMFFAFTLFDFGLSFGSYLANCQFVTIDTFYLILGTNKEEASEFFEFYGMKRGWHPNALGNVTGESMPDIMTLPRTGHVSELHTPLLMITGDIAHSRAFTEAIYANASEPKEMITVEGARHIDLYDDVTKIPFDRIVSFYNESFSK